VVGYVPGQYHMRLRTAVLAAVLVLVTGVAAAALWAVQAIVNRSARDRLTADLERDRKVFVELYQRRLALHTSQARVVAEEPRLKAVVATPDVSRETVMDVAGELSRAVGSDLFLMLDAQGKLLGDVTRPESFGQDLSENALVQKAITSGTASGIWTDGDVAYEAQFHRLDFGTRVVGVLILGHRLDERVTKAVAELTGGVIAIQMDDKLLASSAPKPVPAATIASVVKAKNTQIGVGSEQFLALAATVPGYEGDRSLAFVVGRSLDDALAPGRQLFMVLGIVACVALLLTIVMASTLSSKVAGPVEKLVAFTGQVGGGNMAARAPEGGFIEVQALSRAMNQMVEKLEISEATLAAKRRLEQELEIARTIQLSILPRSPKVEGLEISHAMHPADEVGGDYYDIHPTGDGAWIAVGDVAGHGLKAGVIMLMVQSIVSTLARHPAAKGLSPRDLLLVLNHVLHDNVRARMGQYEFVTFTLMRYDKSGKISYAGAHEDILIKRARSGRVDQLPTPGTWIGAAGNIDGHTVNTDEKLHRGDVMLLYSDGITEAMSPSGEQFGIERLKEELNKAEGSTEEIRDHIIACVRRWSSDQKDDITLMVLRYHG
jgi:phosphoserine phosphatase RsbU/P